MAKEKEKDAAKEPKKESAPAAKKEPRRERPADKQQGADRPAAVAHHSAKTTPRLKERFHKEIAPAMMKEFEMNNPMAVPHLHKIVVNMGVGDATQNAKIMDPAVNELGQITGQKPVVTRAKKSIAAFKVREGMPIGAMVTLRGDRMYEFLDRLMSIVLPRVRDFKGVSTKSFDGRGNYTIGLRDQLIFPEIDYSRVDKQKGMNVTIVTTAESDDQARSLLKHMGMPFRA
jgi:large subunit ribosomal protein L5